MCVVLRFTLQVSLPPLCVSVIALLSWQFLEELLVSFVWQSWVC